MEHFNKIDPKSEFYSIKFKNNMICLIKLSHIKNKDLLIWLNNLKIHSYPSGINQNNLNHKNLTSKKYHNNLINKKLYNLSNPITNNY